MGLTTGFQIPFGVQPLNPVPVDAWSGPYEASSESAAISQANSTILPGFRFKSMEVRLIINDVPKIYWYKNGIADSDLVYYGGSWDSTTTVVQQYSGAWTSYTTVSANLQNTASDLKSLSGNWQSTYSTVSSNSATWVNTTTDLISLSGNWQNTTSDLKALSGNWQSTFSTTSSLSSKWDSSSTAVQSNSSLWNFGVGTVFSSAVMDLMNLSSKYLPLSGGDLTGPVTLSVNSSNDAFRINQIGTGNALVVEDFTNPDSTPFIIDQYGNVGIGTTTLGINDKLTITSGALSNPAITIQQGFINGNISSGNLTIGNFGDNSSEMRISSRGYTTFYTGNATNNATGTEVLRINASGNIGINTTNSTERLTVNGNISASGTVYGDGTWLTATKTTATIVSNAVSLNLNSAAYFIISLTGSVTVSFANPPASPRVMSFMVQTVGTGAASTVTWPSNVKWDSNATPTCSTTLNKVDIFTFLTHDGGVTYYGFVGGQNFPA